MTPRASSPVSVTSTLPSIIKGCYKKKNTGALSASDKIDKVVTNRWLGLPIFAVVMFLVYWIAMVAVGAPATDWANDGVFGDGWHLLGIGSKEYNEVNDEYTAAVQAVDAFLGLDTEAEDFDAAAAAGRDEGLRPCLRLLPPWMWRMRRLWPSTP